LEVVALVAATPSATYKDFSMQATLEEEVILKKKMRKFWMKKLKWRM
jgi:hypothetical protein